MNRKLIIVLFFLTAFLFGACQINTDNINIDVDRGSGNLVTETREVSGFDKVELSGIGDVTLMQGETESLQIEAEDNIIQYITTEVRDGTLYIGFDRKTIMPTKTVKFLLTMRDIRGLATKGVSNIEAEQIDTDRLDISISGTGNISVNDLNAERLDANVSGAGNFNTGGNVTEQKVTLSGAGNYSGEDLQSERADVIITGLGRVVVWATSELDVTISGTGGVDYYGSPQVSQHISGLGKLTHKGDK